MQSKTKGKMIKMQMALAIFVVASVWVINMIKSEGNNSKLFYLLADSEIEELLFLDSSYMVSIMPYHLLHNMTTQLVGLDANGNYELKLAERITFDETKTIVRIKIKNKKFGNQEKITSDDVINTFKRLIILGSTHTVPKDFIFDAENLKTLSDDCKGLVKIDELEIELRLKRPVKELFYYLQLADYGILHNSQYNQLTKLKISDWKVTSGAYRLELEDDGKYTLNWNQTFGSPKNRILQLRAISNIKRSSNVLLLSEKKVQIGVLGFRDLMELGKNEKIHDTYNIIGSNKSSVFLLHLNPNSKMFSNLKTRQWVQKYIHKQLHVPEEYSSLFVKANQYFIPKSPGFFNENKIKQIFQAIDVKDDVPAELKNGFDVRASVGLKAYLPDDMENLLNTGGKIKIRLIFDLTPENRDKIYKEKKYASVLRFPSMTYKAISETLNIMYLGNTSGFLDPSGRVKKNLSIYQNTLDPKEEQNAIFKINEAIIEDSEVVPLFYTGFMKFYDKRLLDASELSFLESLEFAKFKTK